MRLRQKGFTLIELLLGLTIFSLIITCIYSTLAGGIHLSRRSQQQNDIYREMRWSLNWMSKDLENMVPYNFTNSYPEIFACMGDDKKITFLLPTDDGLKVVSYYLASTQGGSIHKVTIGQTYKKNVSTMTKYEEKYRVDSLVREEFDFADYLQDPAQAKGEIEIVASNVRENGLKYSYGYLEGEKSATVAWKNNWSSNNLPRYVRIDIDFQSAQKPFQLHSLTKDIWIPTGSLSDQQS